MKNKLFLTIITILIFTIVGVGVYMSFFKDTKSEGSETVGKFNISDYNYFIESFPYEKVLGPLDSVQLVKENAEIVFIEVYGEEIKDKRPYSISFDENNQVWLVQGSLPEKWVGGVPNILIQKSNGKVLAVWHDK